MVITGALITGDSVRYSLRKITVDRLGKTEFVISSDNHFFSQGLSTRLENKMNIKSVPVLMLKGIASSEGGNKRINGLQVIGINNEFGIDGFSVIESGQDEVIVNKKTAARLGIKVNDEIIIRIQKPDILPQDSILVSDTSLSIPVRVKIKYITDGQMSKFSLNISQVTPYNVFMPIDLLCKYTGLQNNGNIIILSSGNNIKSVDNINDMLTGLIEPEDAGLEIRYNRKFGYTELISDNIFISDELSEQILEKINNAYGIFSYFINEFEFKGRKTPYSIVSSGDMPIIPRDLPDDGIVINQWLADDLKVVKGNKIKLNFYVLNYLKRLEEKTVEFTVQSIIPIKGYAADKNLMPKYPGLFDAASCSDWAPGIPIKISDIRTKDELYWNKYKGTPKAFISKETAHKIWSNPFGKYTAIRFKNMSINEVKGHLSDLLKPENTGLKIIPVLSEGINASRGTVDFGQLFLGLSFFVMIAGFLVAGLSIVFNLENRNNEIGTLRALGYMNGMIRRIYFIENIFIAFVGSVAGAGIALLYNKGIIIALGTIWKGAVGEVDILIRVGIVQVLTGIISTFLFSVLIIWLTVNRFLRKNILELHGKVKYNNLLNEKKLSLIAAIISFISFTVIIIFLDSSAGIFFLAGFLVLISCISFINYILLKVDSGFNNNNIKLWKLSFQNLTRKHRRSISTITILALSIFIIVAVSSNRKSTGKELQKRNSGTGGFEIIGETIIPVIYDLNSREGWNYYGFEEEMFRDTEFIQMRVLEGDEASCLNLNRVIKPGILSVDTDKFSKINPFRIIESYKGYNKSWDLLNGILEDGSIPAIADDVVIKWSLGMSLGDTLVYRGNNGKIIKIKLIASLDNSIFQGKILISEDNFIKYFPHSEGTKFILADCTSNKINDIIDELNFLFQDYGSEFIHASEKLAEFNRVENTYLNIFLLLGGLALMIGTVGMGIVIMRNIHERRGEFAIMRAIGFNKKLIAGILNIENMLIIVIGFLCGLISGFVAALPSLIQKVNEFPVIWFAGVIVSSFLFSIIWSLITLNYSHSHGVRRQFRLHF